MAFEQAPSAAKARGKGAFFDCSIWMGYNPATMDVVSAAEERQFVLRPGSALYRANKVAVRARPRSREPSFAGVDTPCESVYARRSLDTCGKSGWYRQPCCCAPDLLPFQHGQVFER